MGPKNQPTDIGANYNPFTKSQQDIPLSNVISVDVFDCQGTPATGDGIPVGRYGN